MSSQPMSPVDFLLMAPLREEREALLTHLSAVQRVPPDERDIRVYYQAEVAPEFSGGASGAYRIVVASPLGIGRVEAATATADAIRRWQPRYVLLIGIAGGNPAEVALGDVLIADQFVDYEQQKLSDAGARVRYQTYRADPRLYGAAQNLGQWESAVKVTRPQKRLPRCHFGVVISGDKVLAAKDALAPYRSDWPKLIGVEMEAAGAAAAAWEAPSRPGVLMVRGVSDFADANKGSARVEKWRPYACDVAAAYAVALLRGGPVPLSPPVPVSTVPDGGAHVQRTGQIVGVGSIRGVGHYVSVTINQAPSSSLSSNSMPATTAPPTRASLRKLLLEVLRGDAELEAFCIDYFPDTKQLFSSGMSTEQKRNLLLERHETEEIWRSLQEARPTECTKYGFLLRRAT